MIVPYILSVSIFFPLHFCRIQMVDANYAYANTKISKFLLLILTIIHTIQSKTIFRHVSNSLIDFFPKLFLWDVLQQAAVTYRDYWGLPTCSVKNNAALVMLDMTKWRGLSTVDDLR